jgi:hypothetical protein
VAEQQGRCEFLGFSIMLSHPQPAQFNMELCMACEEKPASHNQTAPEKRPKNKTKPTPQADM